jgi:NADP-dependent 3-hydroxy acid dehydrogenase YdfG
MINNAGILAAGRFEDVGIAASHREIDVSCKGMVNGLYAAFPYLRSTPASVAVNLSSASAIYGQPELAIYSSTKFFVRASPRPWTSNGNATASGSSTCGRCSFGRR